MQRTIKLMNYCPLTATNFNVYEYLRPNALYVQSVRWKRKPIWLPTAKTKVFRVPKRPVIPMEETLEIQRLCNNYRTYMKSLNAYLCEIHSENQQQFDENIVKEAEENDFKHCNLINDEWNKNIAKEREARLEIQKLETRNIVLNKLMEKEQEDAKKKAEIDAKIKQLKLESANFITNENIDKAIEEALATIVNHNAAIDKGGNLYSGNYSAAKEQSKDKMQTA